MKIFLKSKCGRMSGWCNIAIILSVLFFNQPQLSQSVGNGGEINSKWNVNAGGKAHRSATLSQCHQLISVWCVRVLRRHPTLNAYFTEHLISLSCRLLLFSFWSTADIFLTMLRIVKLIALTFWVSATFSRPVMYAYATTPNVWECWSL